MKKKGFLKKQIIIGMAAVFLAAMAPVQTFAAHDDVFRFPGFNGSGPKGYGPNGSYYPDFYYDGDYTFDDEDGPGEPEYTRGWRYNPNGWWYQKSDGSWPENCWEYIDGRWYRFAQSGHMVTGWFTDGNGKKYYFNPVDDGTLGMMRTGWQLVDGKMYYFNPNAGGMNGAEGNMLVNTTTPDGYQVGADGALVQ